MAGIGSLDDLYSTFLGQTNTALNQPESPWQQELMASVNPDKVRRENIKQALAQASMALATTPGNFLTGLTAAAGVGANSYLQAKQGAEQDRMKAMQLVQMAQQKDQDRRLSLLMGAIGVNNDIVNASDRKEDRALRRKESDARIAYWNRRGEGGQGAQGLTPYQVGVIKDRIIRGVDDEEKKLRRRIEKGEDISEEEIQRQKAETQQRLERQYGITLEDPEDYTAQADAYSNAGDSEVDLMTGGAQPNIPDRSVAAPQAMTPPPQAIEALRNNPSRRADFDAKYGQGAADRYLGN